MVKFNNYDTLFYEDFDFCTKNEALASLKILYEVKGNYFKNENEFIIFLIVNRWHRWLSNYNKNKLKIRYPKLTKKAYEIIKKYLRFLYKLEKGTKYLINKLTLKKEVTNDEIMVKNYKYKNRLTKKDQQLLLNIVNFHENPIRELPGFKIRIEDMFKDKFFKDEYEKRIKNRNMIFLEDYIVDYRLYFPDSLTKQPFKHVDDGRNIDPKDYELNPRLKYLQLFSNQFDFLNPEEEKEEVKKVKKDIIKKIKKKKDDEKEEEKREYKEKTTKDSKILYVNKSDVENMFLKKIPKKMDYLIKKYIKNKGDTNDDVIFSKKNKQSILTIYYILDDFLLNYLKKTNTKKYIKYKEYYEFLYFIIFSRNNYYYPGTNKARHPDTYTKVKMKKYKKKVESKKPVKKKTKKHQKKN